MYVCMYVDMYVFAVTPLNLQFELLFYELWHNGAITLADFCAPNRRLGHQFGLVGFANHLLARVIAQIILFLPQLDQTKN